MPHKVTQQMSQLVHVTLCDWWRVHIRTAHGQVVAFVVPYNVAPDLFFVEPQTLFFFSFFFLKENGAANT